jgi:acylphosphatase
LGTSSGKPPKSLLNRKTPLKCLEGRKMAVRGTLIVKGDVQGAGYRAFVMKNAQKLGLLGFGENLADGTVKVVCEGEKETIGKFIRLIKVEDKVTKVENIKPTYGEATGEFEGKGFTVKVTDINYELFQGYATSEKYFGLLVKNVDSVSSAVGKMHSDMNKNFSIMAKRYDMIAKSMVTGLKMIGNEFTKSRKEVATALKRLDKTIRIISKSKK